MSCHLLVKTYKTKTYCSKLTTLILHHGGLEKKGILFVCEQHPKRQFLTRLPNIELVRISKYLGSWTGMDRYIIVAIKSLCEAGTTLYCNGHRFYNINLCVKLELHCIAMDTAFTTSIFTFYTSYFSHRVSLILSKTLAEVNIWFGKSKLTYKMDLRVCAYYAFLILPATVFNLTVVVYIFFFCRNPKQFQTCKSIYA